MSVPDNPKIYHIVHVDRLPSIIADGFLFSDAEMVERQGTGTSIGMNAIKKRRLNELTLESHSDIFIGQCIPFYFCPRSVMLYILHCGNDPELTYQGGQQPILHLEADLNSTVQWANNQNQRWAFTLSNAGSYYFEDRNDLSRLEDINWDAVQARNWRRKKDGKQAEFLIENRFSWHLIERIGAISDFRARQAINAMRDQSHKPRVEILPEWYY